MNEKTKVYRRGTHVFVSGKTVDLSHALDACNEKDLTHYLHIYTDKLVLGKSNTVDAALSHDSASQLRVLHIFARDFLSDESSLTELRIKCNDSGLRLFVFNEEARPCLKVSYLDAQGSVKHENTLVHAKSPFPDITKPHSRLYEEDAGREIVLSNNRVIVRPVRNVSRLELAGPSFEDTQAFPDIDQAGFLRKLLEEMFVKISSDIMINSPNSTGDLLSMSRLRYILRCVRLDSASAQFATDAKRFLDRLELPQRFPSTQNNKSRAFYVPDLEPDYITDRLKEKIQKAAKMEKAIQELERQKDQVTDLQKYTTMIIKAIDLTMTSLVDIGATKESAVAAIADLERKRRDLQEAAGKVKTAGISFQSAVKAYKKKKEFEDLKTKITIGVDLVIGIGIAVATCGTGAPLTAATAADAVKKATELSAGQKAWNAVKKLGELIGKMLPKISAADKSQKSYLKVAASLDLTVADAEAELNQSALDGLKTVTDRITADSLPKDEMEAVDFLGIMADWDEVEVDIDAVFRDIRNSFEKGEEFPELSAFETALKHQVIRGQTVLKAMFAAQSAAQLYYRQLAEDKARTAVLESIKALQPSKNDTAKQLAQWHFNQTLVDIKRSIFALFHECLLSLMYFENKGNFPVDSKGIEIFKEVNASIEIGDLSKESFEKFHDKLADLLKDAIGNHREQTFPGEIHVNTSNHIGAVFDKDWKSKVVANKQIAFHVPTSLDVVNGFRRIRIRTISAAFEGLKVPGGDASKIRYYFILGPQNVDISWEWKPVQYYIPAFPLEKQGKKGELLNSKGVLVRPALFCHGVIGFTPEQAKGLDLSTITKVTITFTCEAVSKLQAKK